MSLLDGATGTAVAALKAFADELEAGGREERAVLLNLKEENRLPKKHRTAFQKAIEAAPGMAQQKLNAACKTGGQALPVPAKKRGQIQPEWRTFVTFGKLLSRGLASGAAVTPAGAPRRLPLNRKYGSGAGGESYPFWITNLKDSGDPDEVRDRLGLAHLPAGDALYRVGIRVDANRSVHIPSAIDAGFSPPWRRPPATHTEPWGLTRLAR